VADILTLTEARAALRKVAMDTVDDADLLGYYIPAVTQLCESVAGPIMTASKSRTFNGGGPSLQLPSPAASVTSVTQAGQNLSATTDYTVDLAAGIVYCGQFPVWATFLPSLQNIVVNYTVGYAATSAAVTANHKLAARIILRQLWQSDMQGQRPQFGTQDTDTVQVPTGFAIPRRAWELLRPANTMPGFA
jgi:hypothetical protein